MYNSFVYIAGAGPGDPELVTLKTMRILKICDTVIYDNLVDKTLLFNCKKDCVKIYAGKSAKKHYMTQEDINNVLISEAKKGGIILRLKGGDPFVFGRGAEECYALKKANISYEVIPGITSAIAVPECAGIPVTNRKTSRMFTVITGHTYDDDITKSIDFKNIAILNGTIIFLMGLYNINTIMDELIKNGMSKYTPVAVISNGTNSNQYVIRSVICDIAQKVIDDKNVVSPAIIVIGDCADLDTLSDLKLPLSEVKTAVCGTNEFCHKVSEKINFLGGKTNIVNHVDIVPNITAEFDNELKNIKKYSIIVLTGVNSAKIFFERMRELNIDIRSLSNIKFAVMGSGTRDYIKKFNIIADIMPYKFTSDALSDILVKCKYDNIFIPRALKGNSVIREKLSKANINFKEVYVYNTVFKNNINLSDDVDFITFASAVGVELFFENGGKIPKNSKAVCIGEYTAQKLMFYGVNDFLIADVSNADGIVNAILNEVGDKL